MGIMVISMPHISHFKKSEITALLKTAQRVLQHPGLDILLARHTKKKGRILVITPRYIGTAPQRNTIRRRLKAIFYEEKLFNHNRDCIIIIRKNGLTLSFDNLKTLLKQAFE